MVAQSLAVEPDGRALRGGAELEKQAAVRAKRVVELALVPDRPLVIEQLGALRVPVAGNLERRRAGEVVFDEVGLVHGVVEVDRD